VVGGMLFGFKHSNEWVNYFNLGTDGLTSVTVIAHEVIRVMGLNNVQLRFTGGVRGWPGDVARVSLEMSKLKDLGWSPRYPSSDEACMVGLRAIIQDLKKRDTE